MGCHVTSAHGVNKTLNISLCLGAERDSGMCNMLSRLTPDQPITDTGPGKRREQPNSWSPVPRVGSRAQWSSHPSYLDSLDSTRPRLSSHDTSGTKRWPGEIRTGNIDNTYNCLLFIGNAEIYARISCNTRSCERPGSVWRWAKSQSCFLASQRFNIANTGPRRPPTEPHNKSHRQVEKIINFWRNVLWRFLGIFTFNGPSWLMQTINFVLWWWLIGESVRCFCPVLGSRVIIWQLAWCVLKRGQS